MKHFTIRELEDYTGIKAHTFRAWEYRYALMQPDRTKSNSRIYSLSELEALLDLSLLNKNGCKISEIIVLKPEEIAERLDLISSDHGRQQKAISRLIISMYRMNMEEFESVLNDCFISWGTHITINEVIIPFTRRSGILWQARPSAEEHLVIASVRQKLMLGIERSDAVMNKRKKILFFLPEGNHQELLLLYAAYQAKQQGFGILYMGASVEAHHIHQVVRTARPDYLLTCEPSRPLAKFRALQEQLKQQHPGSLMSASRAQHTIICEQDELVLAGHTALRSVNSQMTHIRHR